MKEWVVKLIDKWIGTPLVVLLCLAGLFRKKTGKIENILVIMFWGIGSNITALPAVKALRMRFPNAKIAVLVPEKNKDLFYKNKNIDELIFVDLGFLNIIRLAGKMRDQFDVAIDTEHWLNISAILSLFLLFFIFFRYSFFQKVIVNFIIW